jgi:hypothetical protein
LIIITFQPLEPIFISGILCLMYEISFTTLLVFKPIILILMKKKQTTEQEQGTVIAGKPAILVISKFGKFNIIFFYEFIDIRPVLPSQFGRLAYIAPAQFKKLNQVVLFKTLFGMFKGF